ncbi:MAG: hypothetical protein P8P74_17875 [Crocinitomicaceae bacterium]|nr:hypothetical protein [Crocinitomicaceae bacterium]
MSRKSLSFFTLIFSGLLLIGCNRGCTTSKTIASESKTISTKNGNAEVVGRVIDYRHSKRVGDNIFNRSVSHSYGLCFDIRFGTYQQEEFFHEGVNDPDAVVLGQELKRVKVAISDDQNHIGLGVDGKVVDIVHLYKSNRIATNKAELTTDGTMDWSKLDINSYPSPQSILTESLKESCNEIHFGSDAIYEFCNSSKPSAKIHKIMLDKWPDCKTARNYLVDPKVRELSRSKKWKKAAVKRGKKVLKDIDRYSFEIEEIIAFIDVLDSKELSNELDEILIERWGTKRNGDYTEMLIERINDKRNPLKKDARRAVYSEAKSEFAKFQQTGESNRRKEANSCIQVLHALGDTTSAYEFVQNAFGKNVARYDQFDFLEVAYDDFGVYTVYQQQAIMQKTEVTFASFKDYSRSSYFMAIDDLVDCSMLQRLKATYPEDLKMRQVPRRCGP